MKDPAFLFYSSDFLVGTMLMTDEQIGKYIRLLCTQHQKGHLKEKDMLNICGSYDEDIYSKFIKDADGLFYNERLEFEANKRKAYAESRRNNRIKKDADMKDISNSYDAHMENGNEIINENKDINKNIYENEFNKLWEVYPNKKGKNQALQKYKLARKKGTTFKDVKDGLAAYLKYIKVEKIEIQYIKHGSTWFNQQCWNDDYTIVEKETLNDAFKELYEEAAINETNRDA